MCDALQRYSAESKAALAAAKEQLHAARNAYQAKQPQWPFLLFMLFSFKKRIDMFSLFGFSALKNVY